MLEEEAGFAEYRRRLLAGRHGCWHPIPHRSI
jgi:hypothetical protein